MQRVIRHRIIVLALLAVAQVAFTGCDNTRPDMTITFESDARGVRDALTGMSQSLADRLALLEAAMESGLADYQAELLQVQQAVDSLGGSLEEKLAAVTEVVKLQGTNLDAKLALIEAAVAAGFADGKAQQALLEEALKALEGSADQKLAALETAIKNRMAGLETKMGLVEAAVRSGLADQAAAQALLKEMVASLGDTLESVAAALDSAIVSQQPSLASKLALIATAAQEGFADEEKQQALIAQALDSLEGSQEEKVAALKEAMDSRLSGLDEKLALIQSSVSKQFTDGQGALNLLLSALITLKGTADGIDAKVDAIVSTLGSFNSTTDTIAAVLANLRKEAIGVSDIGNLVIGLEDAVRQMASLSIEYTDFVVRDTLVISSGFSLKVPYTVAAEGAVQVKAQAPDNSITVAVEPDGSDPLKGNLAITTGPAIEPDTQFFVKLVGKFKTVTDTLHVVADQMTGGEDKTLLYNETFDENKPLIFKYKSNTPTVVKVLDGATWIRVISGSSNEASAECVIKLAVDANTGTIQRKAIVSVTNRVSKHEIKFTVTQDYNSAH